MLRIASRALGSSLAIIAALALAALLRPEFRLAARAMWNDPRFLPFHAKDWRIRFEPAARACADEVARSLPGAIARIEAIHARTFAQAPLVAVYGSFELYARSNGLDSSAIAGVTRSLPFGPLAALLSPTLCGDERARLEGVLTHELSHAHFAGWRRPGAERPPQWFTEGLAVFASTGGGAEGVTDEDAAHAIREGAAVILDDRPWHDFAALGFMREPAAPHGWGAIDYRQRLAYRQAGIFVSWLRALDEARFASLLRRLESGENFANAFSAAFDKTPDDAWKDFVRLQASR